MLPDEAFRKPTPGASTGPWLPRGAAPPLIHGEHLTAHLPGAEPRAYSALPFETRTNRTGNPVWDRLIPSERARVIHLLIERITYDGVGGELEMKLSPAGLALIGSGESS